MKPVDEVFSLLETSPKGLSSTEVKKRLEAHGPNQLKEKEKEPAWKQFFAQFNDFLIWILIGAAIFAMVEAIFQGEPPTDAIIIGTILIINALLGFYQERQAEAAIEALKKMSASKARVVRDGEIFEVLASELVPGDVFVLETGDAVPADGRVIESNEMNSEEASLTGESLPVKKSVDKIDKECPIGDKTNSVFSSTIITYGRGRAIATSTGMNTEIGKIATFISEAEDEQTPLSKKIDAFGKKLGYLILIVCAISFVLYLWRGIVDNPTDEPLLDIVLHSILVAVALAVAAIPEGLPAIVTTSLALGVQRMAKRNAIVRKLPSVETLGCTTVICSDKTGTLTKNEMTIKTVFVDNDFIDVSGIGYEPKGEFSRNGDKIEPAIHGGLNLLAKAGVFCNNATLRNDVQNNKWVITGDPTEAAFLTVGGKLGYTRDNMDKTHRRISEVFFSSERKKMTTVDMDIEKHVAMVSMKGGLEPMLPNCTRVLINGEVKKLGKVEVDALMDAQDKMSSQALRVLAVAYKTWNQDQIDLDPETVEKDLIIIGIVGMIDPPREEVKPAVKECKHAGIKTVMITGDHAATAKAIALELGILEASSRDGKHHIIQGMEIDKLSDKELTECNVFARVAPEHKMRIVKALQDDGNIVAMTGDGVNDAPALKKADAGIAMGITGTDVSKGAADIILTDDNFTSIVAAVEEGRAIYDNMKRFINFLISCNLGEILVIFIAALLGLPAPLLAIHLLWVNLLTDGLPALAMGFEKADNDLMMRPPRPKDEALITKRNTLSYVASGIVISVACVLTFYWGLGGMGHEHAVTLHPENLAPFTVTTSYFEAFSNPDAFKAVLAAQVPSLSPEEINFLYQNILDKTDGELLYYPRTLAFLSLVVSELMNAYNCRSESISIFKKKLGDNWFLAAAVGGSLVANLLVIYVPAAAAVFKITDIDMTDWLFVLAIASFRIWSEEFIKIYWRRTHKTIYVTREE